MIGGNKKLRKNIHNTSYHNVSVQTAQYTPKINGPTTFKISRKDRCRSYANLKLSASKNTKSKKFLDSHNVSTSEGIRHSKIKDQIRYEQTKDAYNFLLNRMKTRSKQYPSSHNFDTTSQFQSMLKSNPSFEKIETIALLTSKKTKSQHKRSAVRPQSHYTRGVKMANMEPQITSALSNK